MISGTGFEGSPAPGGSKTINYRTTALCQTERKRKIGKSRKGKGRRMIELARNLS